MAYEIDEISIDITDVVPTASGRRWVDVYLKLRDQELGAYPSVQARVLVSSDLSLSIGELRAQAADQTKTILREVLSRLEELGPEGWANKYAEQESRRRL